VRATQFFEFIPAIAAAATSGDTVRLPAARFQPMAAQEVSEMVAAIAQQEPAQGIVEIAGPEAVPIALFVSRYLHSQGEGRTVVATPEALYFGVDVEGDKLVAGPGARQGARKLDAWLQGLGR
jgi:uncharacterized protein YbjT (DUF2867 family)